MHKKGIIYKLEERKKMFKDYLELVRQQPRAVSKERHMAVSTLSVKSRYPLP